MTIGDARTDRPGARRRRRRRPSPPGSPLLAVRDLTVEFPTDDGVVHAVDDVSFDGASRTRRSASWGSRARARASRRWRSSACCPKSAKITGEVLFRGETILGDVARRSSQKLRGRSIAMVFQDALAALNPVVQGRRRRSPRRSRVHHGPAATSEVGERVVELLELVGIPNPSDAGRAVPARVLRRDAAAGDDRDVDRERPRPAHRRRADDRARRDDPGAGARRARAHPGPHRARRSC